MQPTRSLICLLFALALCMPAFSLPAPGPLATSSDLTVIGLVVPDHASGETASPLLIAMLPAGGTLGLLPEPLPASSDKSWRLPVGALALAGLLLLPFDAEMAPSIADAAAGERDSFAVQAANDLGTPQVIFPALGALYLVGDSYDKESAKLAAVAFVNAGALVQVGKSLAGRARPLTTGDSPGAFTGPSLTNEYASFPSGHASVAFAVANVLAHRYPKQKWLYYGLAGAVGLARVISEAHFPADVLVGAAVGVYAGESTLRSNGRLLSFTW
jgi:hypothetical protein